MRLSLLLFILKIQLNRAAKRKPSFAARLKKKDFTVVIRTADFKISRYYSFNGGKLLSKKGVYKNPDTEMVWDDAVFAFKLLLKDDEIELMQALGRSKLKLLGNLGVFYWFSDTLELMKSA